MAEPDAPAGVHAPQTRRAFRDAGQKQDARSRRRGPDATRGAGRRPAVTPATGATAVVKRSVARTVFSAVVMTFAAALVATIALPSYAFDPQAHAEVRTTGKAAHAVGVQGMQVASNARLSAPVRDAFSATTETQLTSFTAERKRKALAKQFASYTGPTASDFIKNPAHPPFSLSGVYQTALKYQGVPYVFGGADPSGMDCSGFIMFVYAQFGVALPHSVHQQDGIGTPISQADAQPGDVVIFNDDSHDGFYAGNGMILHAPYPGASIRVQPLWSSDVHFERFGI